VHQFIEQLYLERFGRDLPEHVLSIEQRARQAGRKQVARNATKVRRSGAAVESAGE